MEFPQKWIKRNKGSKAYPASFEHASHLESLGWERVQLSPEEVEAEISGAPANLAAEKSKK